MRRIAKYTSEVLVTNQINEISLTEILEHRWEVRTKKVILGRQYSVVTYIPY